MKILLITDTFAFAGTERHILDLATALQSGGTYVEIACPPQTKLAQLALAAGIPLAAFSCAGWRFLPAIFWLRAGFKARRWDVVHVHNGRLALIGALATWGLHAGALVATQHFVAPARLLRTGWKAALGRRLHRWIESRTHRIVAISEAVKQGILTRRGPAVAKTRVVLNGIQDPSLRLGTDSPSWRRQFNMAPDAPLIACVSRLETEKSIATLVDAVALLALRFPGLQCLIAGVGAEEAALKQQTKTAGLENTIRFLGFQNDPHSLMKEADIFVLPSLAEPFGLVIVEAMAMERPVIAVAAGGPLEIVQSGRTGLLVPPRDSVALAAALQRLLSGPQEARDMGQGGRRLFLERFTAQAMAAQIVQVYQEALGDSPSRRQRHSVGQTRTPGTLQSLTAQSADRTCL